MKNRKEASTKAALDATSSLTVAKMNDLKTYLKKMSESKKEKMWKIIEDGVTLKKLICDRNDLKVSLREQSIQIKEKKSRRKEEKG